MVPDVLWHQRQKKYIKCYKYEWFYNAEPLYEEAPNSFVQHS
jgi:hypothetical protein